jgi:hypothetical protein
MGIAELHEAGALRILDYAAFEGNGAQFISLAAAWSHEGPPGGENAA